MLDEVQESTPRKSDSDVIQRVPRQSEQVEVYCRLMLIDDADEA